MKKINVIDLDNTLLPYDSFKKFLIYNMSFNHIGIRVFSLVVLRVFRFIDKKKFKSKITTTFHNKSKHILVDRFVKTLYSDINVEILKKVNSHSDEDTKNILVTASLEIYVKGLAQLLGWDYIASHFDSDNNCFIHVYGKEKMVQISKKYPKEDYYYNYAVSDSDSDNNLLSMFKSSELLN